MPSFIGWEVSHKEEHKIFHSLHDPCDIPFGETIRIPNMNGVDMPFQDSSESKYLHPQKFNIFTTENG